MDELRETLADESDEARTQIRRRGCHGGLGLLALVIGPEPEAFTHFWALVDMDAPEGRAGLVATVLALRGVADGLVRKGFAGQAADWYRELLEQVDAGGLADLRAGLRCRAALAAVDLGDLEGAVEVLVDGPADDVVTEDSGVGQMFVRDVESYWRLVDGLRDLRDRDVVEPAVTAWLDELCASLRLDPVFQLRRSDADPAATFPLTNPILVRLGNRPTGNPSGELQAMLRPMRKRVERAMGVAVPGIKVDPAPDLAPRAYEVCFGGVPVRTGAATGLDDIVAVLEDFVVANLARLFGPDDVVNWAALAGPELRDGTRDLLDDRELSLVVHRVLQSLLREGVPLTPRAEALDVVANAVADARCDATQALRVARAALLRPVAEGRELPPDLAAGLAAGLADPPVWQLDGPSALALAEQLTEWWREDPDPGRAVVVADPRLRPVVWRLLALRGARPVVLSREEFRR